MNGMVPLDGRQASLGFTCWNVTHRGRAVQPAVLLAKGVGAHAGVVAAQGSAAAAAAGICHRVAAGCAVGGDALGTALQSMQRKPSAQRVQLPGVNHRQVSPLLPHTRINQYEYLRRAQAAAAVAEDARAIGGAQRAAQRRRLRLWHCHGSGWRVCLRKTAQCPLSTSAA